MKITFDSDSLPSLYTFTTTVATLIAMYAVVAGFTHNNALTRIKLQTLTTAVFSACLAYVLFSAVRRGLFGLTILFTISVSVFLYKVVRLLLMLDERDNRRRTLLFSTPPETHDPPAVSRAVKKTPLLVPVPASFNDSPQEALSTCVVCMHNEPRVVCMPCGHLNTCTACYNQIKDLAQRSGGGKYAQCPSCKTKVLRSTFVFV